MIPRFASAGPKVSDLRAEISDLAAEAQGILDGAIADGHRDLTVDENARFAAALGKIEETKTQLNAVELDRERRQSIAEAKSALSTPSRQLGSVRSGPFGALGMIAQPQHKLPKLKAFANTPEGQRDAWLAGNWWKAIRTGDDAAMEVCRGAGIHVGTMTEGNPSAGGYTVPQPLARAIIETRDEVGVARRTAQVQPMDSDTLSVPKLLTGPVVRYVSEAGEFIESDEVWGQLGLTARKRGILTKISRELRDDAIINVVDQLASRMGYEFAYNEDREYILGDGTSGYGGEVGLVNAIGAGGVVTALTGHDTWGELDLPDITAWMAKLPSRYTPGATIICSPAFYASVMLRLLAAGAGNTMQSLADGVGTGSFLGRKVYFTDFLPTATGISTIAALYGDFSQAAMIGDRQGVEIAVSDQRYFEFDLIGVRGVTRYDILVHEPGDASTPGAFVALKTAA